MNKIKIKFHQLVVKIFNNNNLEFTEIKKMVR